MDLAIPTLILALLGFGLAIFAIAIGLKVALTSKRREPIPNGLYRMRKVGEDGLDSIFEMEEVREAKGEPKKESKTLKTRKP